MKNKCNIQVGGIGLTLYTEYDEAYVGALAEDVSTQLETLLKNAPRSSKLDAALLMLLDLTDANKKLEAENGKLKRELESVKLDLEIATIEKEKLAGKAVN